MKSSAQNQMRRLILKKKHNDQICFAHIHLYVSMQKKIK